MAVELVSAQYTGELLDLKMGVSWYSGKPEFPQGLSELWLPDQSFDVVKILEQYGAVTLIGGVGSGKSAILYGARAVMRAQGIPYLTINGHYKNIPAERIIEVIDTAQQQGTTVVYDSADYLVGGNRRTRSMALEDHLQRNLAIMQRLIAFRQDGGTLLMTSHNDEWMSDTAHPSLWPEWNRLLNLTSRQEVNIVLKTSIERAKFLGKVGLDDECATFVASLPENERFLNYVAHKWGDKAHIDRVKDALQKYEFLKLIGRDNYHENGRLIEAVQHFVSQRDEEAEAWNAVLDFIYSKAYLLLFFTK